MNKDLKTYCHEYWLYPPYSWQCLVAESIEYRMLRNIPDVICVRVTRQFGKNELDAIIDHRAFYNFQIRGGCIVRTAPTYRPQIVNSKMRLEKILSMDKIVRSGYKTREGFIYQFGSVFIAFYSSDLKANVVGGTASILLSIDEAHKVDQGKYDEDFAPMTASKAVPTVMWGVAANGTDLLSEYWDFNESNGNSHLNFRFDAYQASEESEDYARHFQARVDKLGLDHPIIQTQYLLNNVKASGRFFSPMQYDMMMAGDHCVELSPSSQSIYYASLDIAGGSENETNPESGRDDTVLNIFTIDHSNVRSGYPLIRLVRAYLWRDVLLDLQRDNLLQLLKVWHVSRWIGDARGIGEQLVTGLAKCWPEGAVIVYKADDESVSWDCYMTQAMANHGRLLMPRDNGSDEWKEMHRQIETGAGRKFKRHELMSIEKADGRIDFAKSITYIPRLLQSGGVMMLTPDDFSAGMRRARITSR